MGAEPQLRGEGGAGWREGAWPEVSPRHVEGSVDGSGAGGDRGEEGERGWGTHCQAFMAQWESEGGHFPELRNQSVYSLRGRKCCEGALKSNVKSSGKVTGDDADVTRL